MAEHDIEKIVEAGGEVFNFRDPTKQPVADRVTSIRAASSATDTNYPTEKAVAAALESMALDENVVHKTGDENVGGVKTFTDNSVFYKVHRDSYYASNLCRHFAKNTPTEFVIWSRIKWVSSAIMPLVRIYGYAYGLQSPIEIKVAFYIYNTNIAAQGAINQGAWSPEIYLWKYTVDSVDYVAIGLKGSCYFCGFQVDVQIGATGAWTSILLDGWSTSHNGSDTSQTIIPAVDTDKCKQVPYKTIKTDISGTATKLSTARKLKTNLARTADSTFDGSADQTNIPVTGTLPVGNGGTGKASVMAGNYVVGAGTSAMVEKTPKDVGSDVLSSLDNKSNASSYADFVDGDFVVGSDHVNASTISASTFVRRTALNLWYYIRSKLSGSDVNIGGNAATATTAQNFDTSTGTIKSALAGKSDTGHVHNTDANEVTSNSTNLAVITDDTEIVTTHTSGYNAEDKRLFRRPAGSKIWPWIQSKIEADSGYINYTYNVTSDTNINSHVLAGIILPGSSLGSCRLMFAMVLNINIGEGTGCGGLVKVQIEISGGGIYYVKRISLSNVTGDLSISDLKIVEGTSANKKVVGLVWNGVLLSNRPMQATVLSRHVVGGDFVYNGDVASGTNIAWETGGARVWAEDGNVVHTTGDETIKGTKTFSNTTSGNDLDINLQSVTNNGTYKMGVEIAASGNRGLWDYKGTGIAGEGKWIVYRGSDGITHVGGNSDEPNTIRIGKLTIDTSGTIGSASNTLYIG